VKHRVLAAIVSLVELVPSTGLACPDCDIGRLARYQFWSDHFVWNLLAALAPFIVVVATAIRTERKEAPHG
jgi:hypothetical protein